MATSMADQSKVQDGIDQAISMVDSALTQDRNYADLSDLLQVPKHNQPCGSGIVDFDYPNLGDAHIGLGSITSMVVTKRIPLPTELVEQFGHMQCNCMMGVYPEISRAWLSIDSDIFMWNYEDGSDLAYFDGLSETILCMSLVKPKPNIFQPHIQYLLCLTTPVDIVLLGVSFTKPFETSSSGTVYDEMHLLPEPLFSIPTDNTHFMSITGTNDGRIFMAGKDGCLYELLYQAEDGWFSRKCRKVNLSTSKLSFMVPSFLNFSFVEDDPLVQIEIDNSRHILYTRSEKGTIQVYDLGEDGKGISRVAAISQQTIMQNASLVIRSVDKANFRQIVYIAALSREESTNVHLVAVSSTGVRLYFTTTPFNNPRYRASMLQLIHIRMPPGFSASSPVQRPANVHTAYYSRGSLLLAASQSEDSDLLWNISSDAFPFHRELKETYETIPLDGRTWALAEVPSPTDQFKDKRSYLDGQPRSEPPVIVTQHMTPERNFVIVNSQGTYIVKKLHPVDQLAHLLLEHGPDSEDVKSYFRLHKEQACSTCLILACRHQLVSQEVSEMARRAFFLYGGEPEINPAGIGQQYGLDSSYLKTPHTGTGAGHFGAPRLMSTPVCNLNAQMDTTGGTSMLQPLSGVMFSDKCLGLRLYLSRLLRPMWDAPLVKEHVLQGRDEVKVYLISNFTSEEVAFVLNKLNSLKEFLEQNSAFTSPLMAEGFMAAHSTTPRFPGSRGDLGMDETARRKYQMDADSQERDAMQKILDLVTRCCEALGLWQILSDHQFHVIAASLSKDDQNDLRNLCLRTFIAKGKDFSSVLINSLINMYLDDNAATDAISSRLRELAPSLYSAEDALCSKGSEKLQMARAEKNNMERQRQLEEALGLYKEITHQLDLPSVCNLFAQARFYRGIVDLSLTAASKRDPQFLALHFYRNGKRPEDQQGLFFYSTRMDCYKCITETLDYLLSTSQSHPQAPSVPKAPGPPPPKDPNILSNAEAEKYAEDMFALAVDCEDELFHVHLYEWLISKDLTEKLLDIKSPYLKSYLQLCSQTRPDNLVIMDLLWRYHEKAKDYFAAAKILCKLAERHGNDIGLQQRMENLSRAAMCAKSSNTRTNIPSEGEFLHELEEKMEVGRLQLQILEELTRIPSNAPQIRDAIESLNSQLVDITTLYGEYAERFELSESKLAIIHCAGHYDPTLVETLWQNIIDKELEIQTPKDPQTKMKVLGTKLVSLGKKYAGSEKYFPIAFLVKYLEQKCCEQNFEQVNPQFVFSTMMEIGVSLPKLHEMYDRLFKSKDPIWKAMRKPHHLLFVLHRLLNTFADSPSCVPAFERRPFTTTCLDSVAHYLVELQAEGITMSSVSQLIPLFKQLQSKLERLVC